MSANDNIIRIQNEINSIKKKQRPLKQQINIFSELKNCIDKILDLPNANTHSNLGIYKLEDIYPDNLTLKDLTDIPYLNELTKLSNYISIISKSISDKNTLHHLEFTFKRLPQIEEFISKKIVFVYDEIKKKNSHLESKLFKEEFYKLFRKNIETSKIMNYYRLDEIFDEMKGLFIPLGKSIKNENITIKVIESISNLQKPLKDQIKRTEILSTIFRIIEQIKLMPEDEYDEYPHLIGNYLKKIQSDIKILTQKVVANEVNTRDFKKISMETLEIINKLAKMDEILNYKISTKSEQLTELNENLSKKEDVTINEKLDKFKDKKQSEQQLADIRETSASNVHLNKLLAMEKNKPVKLMVKEKVEEIPEPLKEKKEEPKKEVIKKASVNNSKRAFSANDIRKKLVQEEDKYLSSEYLAKMYKKNSLITSFDSTLAHIKKSEKLSEKTNYRYTPFTLTQSDCIKMGQDLANRNINLFSAMQNSGKLPEIDAQDIIMILTYFGLRKDRDYLIINEIINKKDFEFFLCPESPIESLEELNENVFTGKIERFAYLKQDFLNNKTGRVKQIHVPIMYIKAGNTLQPITFDAFLYMWDSSRQLVREFFKEEEVLSIQIDDLIFKKESYLPEIVTEDGKYFEDRQLQIEKIYKNNLSENKEIVIKLYQGLAFTYDELAENICYKKSNLFFRGVKIRTGDNVLFRIKNEEINCQIKDIFQHSDQISLILANNNDDQTYFIKEHSDEFFYILLEKSKFYIEAERFELEQVIDFHYFNGDTKSVEISQILQSLLTGDIFVKTNIVIENLEGQRGNIFSVEDFKILIEKKGSISYESFIEYKDLIGVDDIFFSTEFIEETETEDLSFVCNTAFGTIGFYSNKQKNANINSENNFREKFETAMLRVRRGLIFSLIDTNNKYLSAASKEPITNSLIQEEFTVKEIKKQIRSNLEKIHKENLLHCKGSLLTFKHENTEMDTLEVIHAGNSLMFVTERDKVIYQKSLDVNDFGEITNGIGNQKILELVLREEKIKINRGNQIGIISDGFPIRVENGKSVLKGIFAGYEVEKVILKVNRLPIEKRYQLINAIIEINDSFEELAFQIVSDCPKNNMSRENAYQLTKVLKDIYLAPVGYLSKIIDEVYLNKNDTYKKITERMETLGRENINLDETEDQHQENLKARVINFITESVLKIFQSDLAEEEKKKIENYFNSLGLSKIYSGLHDSINKLLIYQKDKKYYHQSIKSKRLIQIQEDQKRLYLKILNILIKVLAGFDEDIRFLISNILLENNDINDQEDTYYLEKKLKIFEPLQTVKTQLDNNQVTMKNEFVLDLEPILRKYLLTTIFKEDFTTLFYDIERIDNSDSLIYNKNGEDELYHVLKENKTENIIYSDTLVKLKSLKKVILDKDDQEKEVDILLSHPKIQIKKVINPINSISNSVKDESIHELIHSEKINKTSFIGNADLKAIFKQLGIEKNTEIIP